MRPKLLDSTRGTPERAAVEAQRASLTPALVPSVTHRGDVLWSTGTSRANPGDLLAPLDLPTRFLIAANSMALIAATMLQLRDDGRLAPAHLINDALPGSAHAVITVRQPLSHTGAIQRELVPAEFWYLRRAVP